MRHYKSLPNESELLDVNSAPVSNPISHLGVIERLNTAINTQPKVNRLYGGYNQYVSRTSVIPNYNELIQNFNEVIKNKTGINELFYALNSMFTSSLNCNYTALALYTGDTDYLNLKLIDKTGSTYKTRVFLKESTNPIVKTFTTGSKSVMLEDTFLDVPHLTNTQAAIYPVSLNDESIGVFIVGDNSSELHTDLYELCANYLGLFMKNLKLLDKSTPDAHIDTLTNLYNHRKFQEILEKQLKLAHTNKQKLVAMILDINNISQINKDFGHAKGDEVIQKVSKIIKDNIRHSDFAARYGGDEIAIIMPNTDADEAKYLAEYFSYLLSCTSIDGVGPIKISVGVATYPNSTSEQEKLLVLAEQAMYISTSKGYQNGISSIVCSEDADFWGELSLNSFVSVMMKRHAQVGVSLDETFLSNFNSDDLINQNHLLEMVTSLAAAIDAKDSYTKGHSSCVSKYSEALARAINLPEKDVERIKLGALLHDIGKIGIPEGVLKKTSNLDVDEWEIMRQHPAIGAEKVLLPNKSLHDFIPIVKYHHEHWDGTGYPENLKGDDIPLEARIVSIADAYHALISDRPYRKGLSVSAACEILKLGANKQWDKNLVRQFITMAQSLSTLV